MNSQCNMSTFTLKISPLLVFFFVNIGGERERGKKKGNLWGCKTR